MDLNRNENEEIKHPSFGKVRFGRGQWNGARFYGSELSQDHYIYLEIDQSSCVRSLTQDKYHSDENIVKIRLSSNQFAELLTSMNSEGVPCTIERIHGEMIEDLPQQDSRKEFVHRKFKDRMKQFASDLLKSQKAVKEIVAKKTLSKADQEELTSILDRSIQEIVSNIPFFAETFQETTDKIITEAKSAVENAIMHKINVLGLEELHKQNNLLKSGE